MRISEVVNKIKVCDMVINNNTTDRRLWNIVWSEDCPANILTQENGRCYFIVVNGEINKIGYRIISKLKLFFSMNRFYFVLGFNYRS